MMPRFLLIGAAIFAGLHGLVHLLGLVAYWPLAALEELPYKTTLVGGRVDLGRGGMRAYSVLWLVAGLGFVVAAAGALAGQAWWGPIMMASAALSLVIAALDWAFARWGALLDFVILVALLQGPRVASLVGIP